jgi:hypothetical protein
MKPDEVQNLVKALLEAWEESLRNVGTLTLILNDCCPDWKNHQSKYLSDSGVIEHTKMRVAPIRELSEAVLRGELDHSLIDKVVAEALKKPN